MKLITVFDQGAGLRQLSSHSHLGSPGLTWSQRPTSGPNNSEPQSSASWATLWGHTHTELNACSSSSYLELKQLFDETWNISNKLKHVRLSTIQHLYSPEPEWLRTCINNIQFIHIFVSFVLVKSVSHSVLLNFFLWTCCFVVRCVQVTHNASTGSANNGSPGQNRFSDLLNRRLLTGVCR